MENKPKRKIGRWVLLAVLVVLAAVVAYAVKTYLEFESLLDTGKAGQLPDSYQSMEGDNNVDLSQVNEKDVYTILVAVTDHGVQEDEDRGTDNTDVMLYVRLDNKTHTMNILQIPRDTYVGDGISVDCGIYQRLNGAYSNGANKENPIANTATAIYELFGLKADKLNLKTALLVSSGGCFAAYMLTVFSPIPVLSLTGCALCGFFAGILWPASFSLSSSTIPEGGTPMFGLLSLGGDIGCSLGPAIVGLISDKTADTALPSAFGSSPEEASLKLGLLAASSVCVVMIAFILMLKRLSSENPSFPDINSKI